MILDNHLNNSLSFSSCIPSHHHWHKSTVALLKHVWFCARCFQMLTELCGWAGDNFVHWMSQVPTRKFYQSVNVLITRNSHSSDRFKSNSSPIHLLNKIHNLRKSCCFVAQNGLISPLAILDTINNCYEFQFWKQCCSVMHDWRNFNNVSFESIMVILYDKGMTTVIHPGTCSQHPFVSRVWVFFLERTVYSYSWFWEIDDKRNNSRKAFRKACAKAFWLWVLKRVSTLVVECITDHTLQILVQPYNWGWIFLGAFDFFFRLKTLCIYANYPSFA